MATLARLNELAEAAVAAMEAADYDLAIRKALALKPLLAVTPEMSRGSAGDSQSLAFRTGDSVDAFIAECRKLRNPALAESGGVFRTSNVRYQRADESNGY